MTIEASSKVFVAFTRYYELLYAEKDYAGEAEYIHQLIQKHRPGALSLLDIGCGTGAHDVELVKRGYSVLGLDFSQEMLDTARKKIAKLPSFLTAKIDFVHGDARTFRTSHRFEVVTSLFHVMSYQTGNGDITAAFETAALHLNQGGLFIFDFWYGPGVLSNPPEVRVRRIEDDETQVMRIAEPTLMTNRNVVEVNYEIHVTGKGKSSVVITELHRMRYFFLPELELMLGDAGFELLADLEWMTERVPNQRTWNAVVCCRLK